MASLASSGIKALSSLLARSWSRKALRVLRKSAANSAQEFDGLISTMRTASMRGRGGSAKMRWGGSPDWTQRQNFFSAETRTLRYSGSMGIVISTHLPPPVMMERTAEITPGSATYLPNDDLGSCVQGSELRSTRDARTSRPVADSKIVTLTGLPGREKSSVNK